MTQFSIVAEPIDVVMLEASVRSEGYGGLVTFLGIVRDSSDGGERVRGLQYEAQEAMALAEFETIANEARERFGDVRVAIAHRVGTLGIGETAVAVCVGSAHRGEAFDACEYVIDELKRRAAIWKKEMYASGGGEWKANP